MKTDRAVIILTFCLVCVIAGCGKNIRLGGLVTFEDGTPVPFGKVVFATDTFQAEGELQKDGSYRLGSLNENDGLPPGTYKVFLLGTEDTSGDTGKSRVAPEFCSRKQTPLTCEVSKSGARTYDFQVNKPTIDP
ncbi:MAG TPA: hypothetical protein DEB39_17100 [Planctomycetaceae bacterium]|nr:hypothetical protein [Planctomycetaceae bacterium]